MKILKKAILPSGFKANGIACGIKKSGRPDLALFYSDVSATAACLFTNNKIIAAPLVLDKKYLKNNGAFRAILVNSGNANALTGTAGIKDAGDLTASLAGYLDEKKEKVLINSTGIIGKRLPKDLIKAGFPKLIHGLSARGISAAQKAIMTTDTFDKAVTVKINIGAKPVTICGIAKGAGMIAPNVATMLVFIFTDAGISAAALKKVLKEAAADSFNCISVDGCMSTNDTVMMLANGASSIKLDSIKTIGLFSRALGVVCLDLAKMIVRDGEGASKFIQIKVRGAKNFSEARRAALSVANSNLFKTAVYGENPNFGRIAAAVGSVGVKIKESDLKIKVSPLYKPDIEVDVSIGRGRASCVVYTSDLTPEYIKINAEYN